VGHRFVVTGARRAVPNLILRGPSLRRHADGSLKVPNRRSLPVIAIATALLAVTAIAMPRADATWGGLDPTFNGSGATTSALGGTNAYGAGVVVQPDGNVVAAGSVNLDGRERFAVVRYGPTGKLDATFGSGGTAITDFGGQADASGIVRQSDGKLVVAGYVDLTGPYNFALARYRPDGALDTGFGNGGKVITGFGGASAAASGIALQPDGKLVVAGNAGIGPDGRYRYAVVRYSSDGGLDPTFGDGGKVTTVVSGENGSDSAAAVAVQADGKIVVAGNGGSPTRGMTVVRYLSDGHLDAAFGAGGIATASVGGQGGEPTALVLQGDGKIVATGTVNWPGSYGASGHTVFAVARYNLDGTLDGAFGAGGTVSTDVTSTGQSARAVTVLGDGRLVVAGGADGSHGFVLAVYRPDGSLDPTVGDGGMITADPGWAGALANGLAVQADGNLVAVGNASVNQHANLAVARYRLTASSANRLVNPGFELDANGDNHPDNWTNNAKFTRSSAVAGHQGTYEGRFSSTANDGAKVSQTLSGLTAGKVYAFSGWANIPTQRDSMFSFKFQVRWLDAGNVTIKTTTVKTYTSPTTGWNKATANLTAPAGTTHAQIRLVAGSLNGTFYVDDLVIQ
jgi:uncharacterized delta-60 repeat protein